MDRKKLREWISRGSFKKWFIGIICTSTAFTFASLIILVRGWEEILWIRWLADVGLIIGLFGLVGAFVANLILIFIAFPAKQESKEDLKNQEVKSE